MPRMEQDTLSSIREALSLPLGHTTLSKTLALSIRQAPSTSEPISTSTWYTSACSTQALGARSKEPRLPV